MAKQAEKQVTPRAMAGDVPVYCAYDELVSTQDLKQNPRNPNTHGEKQIQLLSKIIQEQGWRSAITVSTRSGYIVKGHGRLMAAMSFNADSVPVEYQDYESEEAEHADLIADNQIAELSEMDNELLESLLQEMSSADFDMELTGFSDEDLDLFITSNETHDIDGFFEDTEEADTQEETQDEKSDFIECPKCGAMFKQ